MNGKLFDGLNKLIFVFLNGNECIDEEFKNKNALSTMPQIVSTQCGFLELNEDTCSKEKAEIESKTAEIAELLEERQRNTVTIQEMGEKIKVLKRKIDFLT